MSDLNVSITSLHIHPVKSCAGLTLREAAITATGLQGDRGWMVVDAQGDFLTQRTHPRMALIRPELSEATLTLHAPALPPLRVAASVTGERVRVRVWSDHVAAFDAGAEAAAWLSSTLDQPGLRLVRFDPAHQRVADRQWTGAFEATTAFADAFPLLVASAAGLAELNRRLAHRGIAAVGMERFRPNLVLDGLDAHGEDFIDELRFATPEGPVTLKLVKPCVRCTIPSVDPATGVQGTEPGDTLAGYRADARMQGGITFGMNAIVVEGVGRTLQVGMTGEASFAF
jgi:uncharacterized protein YcbX